MRKFFQKFFLVCGGLLTLAAFPGFAQKSDQIQLNKRPLEDLAQEVGQRVNERKVDLTKSFSVELSGVLDENGKLDRKTAKFIKSEGDVEMIEIGKLFIEAVDNAGFFAYLKSSGIEKINFILGQDDSRTYAVIKSEMPTAERAATTASGLNILFGVVRTQDLKKVGEDEKFLISGAKAENAGKTFTVKMDYVKSDIQELIKRKLKSGETKRASGE